MKPVRTCKALLLAAVVAIGGISPAFAAVDDSTLDAAVKDTAKYVYEAVQDPQVGSIGGEWAVLGLARSGYDVPGSYYQKYYNAVEDYVKNCKGVLHDKKYTEYSRVIVALSAIGKDAANVAGYDLTRALGDYDKTIWQGMNGPIWALIALDSNNYAMPENEGAETQATRQMYVDRILECQLADGGFASWGTANSESVVQMIVALCELDISLEDSRFVKNGNTMLDNLMTDYQKGAGFLHTKDGSGSNQMATEQGFYALVAAQRARQDRNSLYRMGDAIQTGGRTAAPDPAAGLPGKHADVKKMPVTAAGKTFDDVKPHENQAAIEALASRGIINGKTGASFDPDGSITRAEFATIVVNTLGLTAGADSPFADAAATAWYAPYIGTAYRYGIVSGTSATAFAPSGTITRQEAAAMVARAAEGGMSAGEKVAAATETASGSSAGAEQGSESYSETPGMAIDPKTGKDKYMTDPVPEGKPIPVEPQDAVITDQALTCTLSLRCDTILDNIEWLNPKKVELVPDDGVIFPATQVTFYEGESVFHVLQREMKKAKIHMEFTNTRMYNSAYIEGIHNLYEFDCGELSGWMYKVNGWFPNYGCSRYQIKDGDVVEWVYTCDLGVDVGGYSSTGN